MSGKIFFFLQTFYIAPTHWRCLKKTVYLIRKRVGKNSNKNRVWVNYFCVHVKRAKLRSDRPAPPPLPPYPGSKDLLLSPPLHCEVPRHQWTPPSARSVVLSGRSLSLDPARPDHVVTDWIRSLCQLPFSHHGTPQLKANGSSNSF